MLCLKDTGSRFQVQKIVACRLHQVLGITTSRDGHDVTLHAAANPGVVTARLRLEQHHCIQNGRPVRSIEELKAGATFEMQLRCVDGSGSTVVRRIKLAHSGSSAGQIDGWSTDTEATTRPTKRPKTATSNNATARDRRARLHLQVPDIPMAQLCETPGHPGSSTSQQQRVCNIIARKLYQALGINTGKGSVELSATGTPGVVTALYPLLPAHDFRKGRRVENLYKLKQGTPFAVTLNSDHGGRQFVRPIELVVEGSTAARLDQRDRRATRQPSRGSTARHASAGSTPASRLMHPSTPAGVAAPVDHPSRKATSPCSPSAGKGTPTKGRDSGSIETADACEANRQVNRFAGAKVTSRSADLAAFRWFIAEHWIFVPMHSTASDAACTVGGDQPLPEIGTPVTVWATWVEEEPSTAGSTQPEHDVARRQCPWHAMELEPYSVGGQ